eukprot:scaffold11214_cov104-Skeletonema_marinoi.AAC.1
MRLLFGTIIVVACKPDLQLERLHKRNPDLTLEQCRQRIASQIPVEKKAAKAHVVIRNDEDLKSLKCQVQVTKANVAEKVSGKQHRGVELTWRAVHQNRGTIQWNIFDLHSFFFLLIEESNPTLAEIIAMSDDPASIWDDPRVNFVVQCIQSTHSKLSPGAKFDKLFRTEATW